MLCYQLIETEVLKDEEERHIRQPCAKRNQTQLCATPAAGDDLTIVLLNSIPHTGQVL